MAFPTIPTTAAGRLLFVNQLNTTATRTFPDLSGLTKSAGDLLIAVIVAYQTSTGTNAAFSGWTGGFTEFHDSATSTTLAIGCAYKWSTGSETGTFAVTQAGTITGDASMIVMSIPGAHASTPPEAGSRGDSTGGAIDPVPFNPSGWDVEDTLWISVVGSGMTNASGTWTGTGATGPTNYTDRVDTNAADTSVIGDTEAAVAFRQNAVASEDVGLAGGVDVSNARNSALLIAVRPAALVPIDLVVQDSDHGSTSDNITVVEVLPPVDLVVDSCSHSHVSQQLAQHYLTPSVGYAERADPGPLPLPNGLVMKVRGPTASLTASSCTIISRWPSSTTGVWTYQRANPGSSSHVPFSILPIRGSPGPGYQWSVSTPSGASGPQFIGVTSSAAPSNTNRSFTSPCFTSSDQAVWTQAGTGAGSVHQGLANIAGPLRIGHPGALGSSNYIPWNDRIYWVEMWQDTGVTDMTNPVQGTMLWRFDPSEHVSGTSWVDARGVTWTLSNASAVTHVAASSNITMEEIQATNLVVQNAQHNFVIQTDFSPFLNVAGSSANVATCPDPFVTPQDGYIFVIKQRGPFTTTPAYPCLVSQNRADPQRSFKVTRAASSGSAYCTVYTAGTSATAQSSMFATTQTPTPNVPEWWASAYNSTTGAYRTLTSTDGVSYTQRESGTTGPHATFDSNALVTIGADGTGSTDVWNGYIFFIELRTGNDPVAGTLLWKFDPAEHVSGTSWIDARGHTWTLGNAAALTHPITDTPTLTEVPVITLSGLDSYHTVVSQQPAESYYLQASSATMTMPDWGAMPTTWCVVAKMRDGPSGVGSSTIVGQIPGGGDDSWGMTRSNNVLGVSYSATGAAPTTTVGATGIGRAHWYVPEWLAIAVNAATDWRVLKSADQGQTWTTLSTQGGLPSPLFDSTGLIRVGYRTAAYPGQIHWIEMRSGIDPNGGALLWRFDPAEHVSGGSWTDARGHTWTTSNPALITHIPAASDLTLSSIQFNLVVQDCFHTFATDEDPAPYLNMAIGNAATTPDPMVTPQDGFVFVTKARGPQVTGASPRSLTSQWTTADRGFNLMRWGDHYITLEVHPTAAAAAVKPIDRRTMQNIDRFVAEHWAVSYNATTGAWRTLASADSGATYVEKNSGTATPTAVWDSAAAVNVGDASGGASEWDDRIYWCEMRTGNDPKAGTLLWRFDLDNYVSGTSWTDARGNTWISTVASAIVKTPGVTENFILQQVTVTDLVVQDSYQALVSDEIALIVEPQVQHAIHAVTSDIVKLEVNLAVQNAAHTVVSDNVTLSAGVAPDDSSHVVTSSNVVLVVDLAVQSAAHAHSATNVAPLGVDLYVANAAHVVASDNVSMDGSQNLSVQAALHAVTSDNIALYPVPNLAVAAGAHVVTSDSPMPAGNPTVQNAAHAVTSDNVALGVNLVVANAAHVVISDNVLLNYVVLVVANCANALTSDNVSGVQVPTLGVQSGVHEHTASNIPLGLALGVQDAIHAHSAGNITLNYVVLAVAPAAHAVTSDAPALVVDLAIQSAVHAHTASNLIITPGLLNLNAAHAVTSDNIAVGVNLVVQNAAHGTIDGPDITLVQINILTVASAVHAHTASGNLLLIQQHFLSVDDVLHGHSAQGDVLLTQVHYLEIDWAYHAHEAGEPLVIVALNVEDAFHAHNATGNLDVSNAVKVNTALSLYYGAKPVSALYAGSVQVWP